MVKCWQCDASASIRKSDDGNPACIRCFTDAFEAKVHNTIVKYGIFKRGEKVAIGASGGKDSTVLAYVLNKLNQVHEYGIELILLSIDEGIAGYRDDSLKAVERNKIDYGLPLVVLSYKELYGWTMDEIVAQIGSKNNCTFCGVFRRRALDRGAAICGADNIVTGHNADDIAETLLLNILRGDISRLQRCTDIVTGSDDYLPRKKPFKHIFEKDIVMYAHFKRLDYFSTECKYAPNSFRAYIRNYVKQLGRTRPKAIQDLIKSGDAISNHSVILTPDLIKCYKCGQVSSKTICKSCLLLEGLVTGNYNLGIKKKPKKGTEINGKLCACEKDDNHNLCF